MRLPRAAALLATLAAVCACSPAKVEHTASDEFICWAAMATVMAWDEDLIKVERVDRGVVYLLYVAPEDGSHWPLKCKVEDSTVVWGEPGERWRDRGAEVDGLIEFQEIDGKLKITESYGDSDELTREFDVPH